VRLIPCDNVQTKGVTTDTDTSVDGINKRMPIEEHSLNTVTSEVLPEKVKSWIYGTDQLLSRIAGSDQSNNTSTLCCSKTCESNDNVSKSLCLSEKDRTSRIDSTCNSNRLNSSSCVYSEAVKQTTCTTTTTSGTVVYKCRQCNRLFVSLISVQQHRLAVRAARSDLIGCGLCGIMYETEQKAKSCFYHHVSIDSV